MPNANNASVQSLRALPKNTILPMVFLSTPIVLLNKSHRSNVNRVRARCVFLGAASLCCVNNLLCFIPISFVVVVVVFKEDSVAALKDAVDEYALMTNLVLINVSNSKSLDRAPLGWAYVPNENLVIDVHDAADFFDLPFQLCSSNANLTKLDVSGTVAETAVNWNGQLSAANWSAFDTKSLNVACLSALKGLTTLSLAGNNLTLR